MAKSKKQRKQPFRLPRLPDVLGDRVEAFQMKSPFRPTFQQAFEFVVQKGLEALDGKSVAVVSNEEIENIR